jgi:acyl-CoA reductase-like NAD-dependent aldehyde dehydrogenase
VPAGNGAFYAATVLTDVQEGCPAYDEEIFGPVFSRFSIFCAVFSGPLLRFGAS